MMALIIITLRMILLAIQVQSKAAHGTQFNFSLLFKAPRTMSDVRVYYWMKDEHIHTYSSSHIQYTRKAIIDPKKNKDQLPIVVHVNHRSTIIRTFNARNYENF